MISFNFLAVFAFICIVKASQYTKYNIYANLTVSAQFKPSLQVKQSFPVSKYSPETKCMIACTVEISCALATVDQSNSCTLFSNQTTLINTVFSENTKLMSKTEMSMCFSKFYADMSMLVCRPQKTINISCLFSDECLDMTDLECLNGYCQCPPNIKYWNATAKGCLNKKLNGSSCSTSIECLDTTGLVCLNNMCQCGSPNANYWSTASSNCFPKKSINLPCSSSLECLDALTLVCFNSTCQCSLSPNQYYWSLNVQNCLPKKAIGYCNSSNECLTNCSNGICQGYTGIKIQNNQLYIYWPNESYTEGLVNYWPFAGSTRDIISGDDLVIKLNGALAADQYGAPLSSLLLYTGYGTVPAGSYFSCTTGYTFMTWVYINSYTGGFTRIFEFTTGNGANTILVAITDIDKSIVTQIQYIELAKSSTPISIGVWTHVTVTYQSSSTIVYFNGIQKSSGPGPASCIDIERTSCKFGHSDQPGDSDLNANLDEIKIFNRVLSSGEILQEMNKPQPYKIVTAQLLNVYTPPAAYTTGLVNYWPFSNSTVDVVSGMNLTIVTNGQYVADRLDNSDSAIYFNLGFATAPPGIYFDCAVGYTIMMWIKVVNLGYYPRILEFTTSTGSNIVSLQFHDTTGYIQSSTLINGAWSPFARIATPITVGVWTHLATTVNTNVNNIYINGQLSGTAGGGVCTGVQRTACRVGHTGGGEPCVNAVLDELKIFNRVLTANEIVAEMNLIEPYSKIIVN